jgi:hypothetical protein
MVESYIQKTPEATLPQLIQKPQIQLIADALFATALPCTDNEPENENRLVL